PRRPTLFPYTTLFRSVPSGTNSFASATARVTVTTRGRTASTSFTVRRAALELYVLHGSVKRGAHQTIEVAGPQGAGVKLTVTWRSEEHTSELQSPCNL